MPDVLVTLPSDPRLLALVKDAPKLYCGEPICGPNTVQSDGNVAVHEYIDPLDPTKRSPETNMLLGLAGAGPGPLKCGQHKASRYQTIWTGLHQAIYLNLTERILQTADNSVMSLLAESSPNLDGLFDMHPTDIPLLLVGGDNFKAVDWFPQEEDTGSVWVPQEEDAPTPWTPQEADTPVFSGEELVPYTPTPWVDGVTPLDAAKLNNLEGGVLALTTDMEQRVAKLAKSFTGDLDTLTDSGWYTTPAAAVHAPIAQKGFVKVEHPNDSWIRQVFYQYDVALPGPTYIRVYNPTPGTWTAWTLVSATDLSFDGDWVAGTYQEGDTVVKDGVLFLCVGGPTSTAPDTSLWGGLGTIPAVQNNKWLKGSGGAMVWANPTSFTSAPAISAANTDLANPDVAAALTHVRLSLGGGSLRSIAAPIADGARMEILLWGGFSAITLLHQAAGGTGQMLYIDNAANAVLSPGYTASFIYGGGDWYLTGITRSGSPVAYGTSFPTNPGDGMEAVLTDSLTAPTYAWRFLYQAGISDANKWVFVGGASAASAISTPEATASLTFVDLVTVGPSLTIARAGVYDVTTEARIDTAAAASSYGVVSPKLGVATTAENDGIPAAGYDSISTGVKAGMFSRTKRLTIPAATVVKLQYHAGTAASVIFQERRLAIVPVRVA